VRLAKSGGATTCPGAPSAPRPTDTPRNESGRLLAAWPPSWPERRQRGRGGQVCDAYASAAGWATTWARRRWYPPSSPCAHARRHSTSATPCSATRSPWSSTRQAGQQRTTGYASLAALSAAPRKLLDRCLNDSIASAGGPGARHRPRRPRHAVNLPAATGHGTRLRGARRTRAGKIWRRDRTARRRSWRPSGRGYRMMARATRSWSSTPARSAVRDASDYAQRHRKVETTALHARGHLAHGCGPPADWRARGAGGEARSSADGHGGSHHRRTEPACARIPRR